MTLPKKYRFAENPLDEKVKVVLDINREPISVTYRHPKWKYEKELKVMGLSKNDDLIPSNTPVDDLATMVKANQYILSDRDMHIYEAYIYVRETENGVFGYMSSIKTIPSN